MTRIVLHDFGGYPFTAQLGRALSLRGHETLYLHAGGLRPPLTSSVPPASNLPSFAMDAVGLEEPIHRGAGPRRLLQERRYARLLARRIGVYRPDVVIGAMGSLDIQSAALRAAHANEAAFVFWLQDLYTAALRNLLGRRSRLIGTAVAALYGRTEQRLLRRAEAVVSITPDFLPLLDGWGVDGAHVAVMPNWAPLDEIALLPRDNAWARDHGLVDKTVFLYAGTLGRKHDPTMLIEVAERLPDVVVVVVSEGVGMERLRSTTDLPSNMRLLPHQPHAEVARVLASADVLVAILEEDAGAFSVPSKVLTYLAAGRPILAAIPSANQAAQTIRDAEAGIVVDPAARDAFVAGARQLASDADLRANAGASGRRHAERAFDIGVIANRWEGIIGGAMARRRRSNGMNG